MLSIVSVVVVAMSTSITTNSIFSYIISNSIGHSTTVCVGVHIEKSPSMMPCRLFLPRVEAFSIANSLP